MLGGAIRDIAGEGLRPDDQILSEENGDIKYRAVLQNDENLGYSSPSPTDVKSLTREPSGREVELILYKALKSPHLLGGPRKKMLLSELQSWAFENKKIRRLAPRMAGRNSLFEPKVHSLSSMALYRQIKEANPRLDELLGFKRARPTRNYNAVRATQISADGCDQVEVEGVLKSEQVSKVAEYSAAVQPEAPLFTPIKRRKRDQSLKLVNAQADDYGPTPKPGITQNRKTVDAELLLLAAHAARFPVPFAA
jgi:hypothetical protein